MTQPSGAWSIVEGQGLGFGTIRFPGAGQEWTNRAGETGTITEVACGGRIVRWQPDGEGKEPQGFLLGDFLGQFS